MNRPTTPVCGRCMVSMTCAENGVNLELIAGEQPYQIWNADRFECKGCGAAAIVNFARLPIAEYWEPDYSTWAEALKPLRWWSTWLDKRQAEQTGVAK